MDGKRVDNHWQPVKKEEIEQSVVGDRAKAHKASKEVNTETFSSMMVSFIVN